jgi:carbon starvation protein
MSLPLLALIVLGGLAAGYFVYGRFIARQFRLDDAAPTPAQEVNDGVDYVPTKPFYLLGQHFSAIAAAGPIAGPILACQQFGWLPCILWIGLGAIFIGAVHDFSALVASVRHKARSVCEIAREHMGRPAWIAMLAFIWIALVYVILAFADVTAVTFVNRVEVEGKSIGGGAVAFASVAYLALAVLMGLIQRKWNPPLWAMTAVFVPATLGVVWLGTQFPNLLTLPHWAWAVLIMAYCVVASLVPVWSLLQPRGYLGGFILYIVLIAGLIGMFFGGYEIRQPMTTSAPLFGIEKSLFPFLFVTIACGACSGFHGLVSSGTTSKQVARESHCRPVGFGGMLLEGLVALIALATIMIVAKAKGTPGQVYGSGVGEFLSVVLGRDQLLFATVFGTMAFSTFVFDTLDVATRLGRYVLQELTGSWSGAAALGATVATAAVPLGLLLIGGKGGYLKFWTLFGTSNQLLAAMTLLAVGVWLKRTGRPAWFAWAPMAFVMAITMWALAGQAIGEFRNLGDPAKRTLALANGSVAVALAGLAIFLAVQAARAMRRPAVLGSV